MASIVFVAPLINLLAYVAMGFTSGWEYALITFIVWLFIMIAQHVSSEKNKQLKLKESKINDERQKLVNDMVVGARTIKSYGWENHYIQKTTKTRQDQAGYVFWQLLIGMLGFSIFQNGGLIACILIFVPKWARGEQLMEGDTIAVMTMVYFIFLSINNLTYMAMISIQNFLAIVFRVS